MKDEGRNRTLVAAALALITIVSAASRAAELHLRRDCRCDGALVTVGDVADVYSNDDAEAAQLAAIELFPAPAKGQSRLVRPREIQDVLAQRGVDLRRCRMSGASAVNIQGAPSARTAGAAANDSVKQNIESRISEYLQHIDSLAAWQVTANVTGELQRTLADGGTIQQISGGRDPWVGSQRFTVTVVDNGTQRDLPVIANVQRPFAVVVPIRPLPRGRVVQASDLQLQTTNSSSAGANSLSHVDHAVGQETTRALPAGRPLQKSDVRPAVLVSRNAVVTVFARSPGIQVRTSAKALEDGSRDDVIKLQSLNDRDEHFLARVTAYTEVEILAGSPRVETPVIGNTAPLRINNPTTNTNRLGTTQRPSAFGLRVAP